MDAKNNSTIVFISEILSFLKLLFLSDTYSLFILSSSEHVELAKNYKGYQGKVAGLKLLQHLRWCSL